MSELKKDRLYVLLLSVLLFFSYAYFFQGGRDNGIARLAQTDALVTHGALNIDAHAYRSADVIKYEGRFYPNKAPGLSFLCVPAWALFKKLTPLFMPLPDLAEHIAAYLTILSTVGFYSILLCLALYLVCRALQLASREAFFIAAFFGIGTIALPFSTMLFSHQVASCFCFLAFAIVFALQLRAIPEGLAGKIVFGIKARPTQSYFFSGLLLGYALCLEYPAAICAGLIGLYALYHRKSCWQFCFFLLGASLGVIPLLVYNYLISGSILFIPYAQYATQETSQFPGHKLGFLGVRTPPLENFLEILFKPQRGLLFIDPWLIFGFLGLIVSPLWRNFRGEALVCFLIVICFTSFNAGYGNDITYWGGGASTGPRHIIPALPFLTLFIAPFLKKRWLYAPIFSLALLSSVFVLLATAVEPRLPYEYNNPLKEFLWLAYLFGDLSQNPHGFFNSTPIAGGNASFTLGRIFGLSRYFELVPLIIFWATCLTIGLRKLGTGVVLFSFYGLVALAPYLHHRSTQPELGQGEGFIGQYIRGLPLQRLPQFATNIKIKPELIALKRVDQKLAFDWATDATPIYGPFTIIWSGTLNVQQAGSYHFALRSDDGSALYIDNQLRIENWSDHGASTREVILPLAEGEHPLLVLYYNSLFNGEISLQWAKQGQPLQLLRAPYVRYDQPFLREMNSPQRENLK